MSCALLTGSAGPKYIHYLVLPSLCRFVQVVGLAVGRVLAEVSKEHIECVRECVYTKPAEPCVLLLCVHPHQVGLGHLLHRPAPCTGAAAMHRMSPARCALWKLWWLPVGLLRV